MTILSNSQENLEAPANASRGWTRLLTPAWVAAALLSSLPYAQGQVQNYFMVGKGQVYSQSSASAPVPASAGGDVFEAYTPSFGGAAFVAGVTLAPPLGGARTLALSADGTLFQFTDSRNSVGDLDSAYPAGQYVLTLSSSILGVLNGAISLPSDAFPAAPLVSNFAGAQAINATNDFALNFQAFAGASSPDAATLEIYAAGSLLVSYDLGLTDTSVTVAAGTLTPGTTYEGRLRFRHIVPSITSYPPTAYGFYSETRFPLVAQSNQPPASPPTLLQALPMADGALPDPSDAAWFQFSELMDQSKVAIQWSATLNGAAFPLAPAAFVYSWISPYDLYCAYAPQAGGWPLGLVVNWTLNPTTNNASNFAATNGLALAVDSYAGSFQTTPGPCNCEAVAPPPPDWAPTSLAGSLLAVSVLDGTSPLASSGVYDLFTSLSGTNFVVLGNAASGLTLGTYAYAKTSASSSSLSLAPAGGGASYSLALVYASSNSGTLVLSGPGGAAVQHASFSITNYEQVIVPELLASECTNGQFQACVSGQPGLNYIVETSPDLQHWSLLTNLTLSDVSAAFSDQLLAHQTAGFYRARIASDSFAPDSLVGQTLNLSVAGGEAPLAVRGTWQWEADTNDNGYQIFGMTATGDSSGSFNYTRTGPDSGLLALTDSQAGAGLSMELAFSSPTTGFYYSSIPKGNGAQLGSFTLVHGFRLFLGNMHFGTDDARAASLTFAADGNPATLTVTNADGCIWTLSFPADALPAAQTITMRPLTNIDASASLLPVASGVLLEPNGLQFADGVTLSVTTPAPLSTNATLLLANHDGSDLQFLLSTNQGNTYSATLDHFTSAGVSDPTQAQLAQLREKIFYAIQDALDQIIDDVDVNIATPPEPPDFEPSCDQGANPFPNAAVNRWLLRTFNKEEFYLQYLPPLVQQEKRLGGDDSTSITTLYLTKMIKTSMFTKVNWLMNTYQNNVKKVMPVDLAWQQAEFAYLSVAGGLDTTAWSAVFAAWYIRFRDYEVDQVRTKDDYSKPIVAWRLNKKVIEYGPMFQAADQVRFVQNLVNALTCQLTVKIQLTSSATGPQINEVAQGTLVLTNTVQEVPEGGLLAGSSSGQIKVLAGQQGPAIVLAPSLSYIPTGALLLNCETCKQFSGTLSLALNAVSGETWFNTTTQTVFASPVLETYWTLAFQNQPINDGVAFPISIQNLNPQAAQQIYYEPAQGGAEFIKMTLTIQHTPQ